MFFGPESLAQSDFKGDKLTLRFMAVKLKAHALGSQKRRAALEAWPLGVGVRITSTGDVTISLCFACSLVGFRASVYLWPSTIRPLQLRQSYRSRLCTASLCGLGSSPFQAIASDCSRGNTGRKQERRQQGNDKRQHELYDAHLEQTWQDMQSSTDDFDKNLLAVSSGALGLSVGFIKAIVHSPTAVWHSVLYISWMRLAASRRKIAGRLWLLVAE